MALQRQRIASAVFSALAAWSASASAHTADTTATPATAAQPALQPIVVTATPFGSQDGSLEVAASDSYVCGMRVEAKVTSVSWIPSEAVSGPMKVGFNRATRIIDELEKHGIIGPLDTRNPGAPRTVYGPDNWIRDNAQADAEPQGG